MNHADMPSRSILAGRSAASRLRSAQGWRAARSMWRDCLIGPRIQINVKVSGQSHPEMAEESTRTFPVCILSLPSLRTHPLRGKAAVWSRRNLRQAGAYGGSLRMNFGGHGLVPTHYRQGRDVLSRGQTSDTVAYGRRNKSPGKNSLCARRVTPVEARSWGRFERCLQNEL